MVAPRELDPSASALDYFGSELRRLRLQAGLSQERLGEIVNYTGALVGLVEMAKRPPSRDFADRCDGALGGAGVLTRLWPLVIRSGLPSWFQDYAELEARAVDIRTYQAQVVHGLLQTEEYARAVLRPARPGDLDGLTEARMKRQEILRGANPPRLWMVLDEAALRRPVGGPEVMRTQLRRLLDHRESPRVVVQVLPYSAGAHASLNGSLTLLDFEEGPELAYNEGHSGGRYLTEPSTVEHCGLKYDLLRAAALSPDDSADFIVQVLEELYGQRG
ncbi:helix-turn-helix transcriptional regulator [Streptomyces sp. DSM 42041]|uniref:Helix-turn-helix transcriptional regulator n=1 Tax=Streptomyces hazeniae TaxID=3075538 RepID=A0ABU2NLH1_9ACTN|nr:helix-turn-helix transcriptional regulator [Streptomyces sp. DSM 42041]MDT0377817.1 helix-turn-helix transcriptional regulator [Streptomyces sp. DSM 42041]